MKRNTLHLEPGTDGEAVGKRRCAVHLHVMVSAEERALSQERMAEAESRNMGACKRWEVYRTQEAELYAPQQKFRWFKN